MSSSTPLSRAAAGLSLLAVTALLGCSSPMPPWTPAGGPPMPPAKRPAPTAAAPIPAPAPSADAPQPAPYNDAVAARFPEPAVDFRTPAFQPGHPGFTTNAELQAVLREIVHGGRNATLLPLGSSQAGVPLEAVLFTRNPDMSPAAVLKSGRPTVLLVGQQHGDEPAGSEALIVLARELAGGNLQDLLDRVNVVILPRANPDGAQAQRRVTASGIDANRDHLLLRTPEAQAQARLVRDFQPVLVVDSHEYTVVGRFLEKFGALQRFDALVQYATTANMPEFITKASEEWFRQPMLASLKQQGLSAEWYYTTSVDMNDKKISMGGTQPDTGRNVNGLKNAVSILIETRGVGIGRLHLKRRVQTHVVALGSFLRSAADRSADLVKLRQYVDAEVAAKACQGDAVVEAGPTPSEYTLQMLDPATGADKALVVNWDSALELQPLKTRPRACGYWLAADQSDAVMRLRTLGVRVEQVAAMGVMQGEVYAETSRQSGARQDVRGTIADGGAVVHAQVQLTQALMDVPIGSYYVPLSQPLANLVIAALEPDTQNSFFANRLVSSIDRQARMLEQVELKGSTVP